MSETFERVKMVHHEPHASNHQRQLRRSPPVFIAVSGGAQVKSRTMWKVIFEPSTVAVVRCAISRPLKVKGGLKGPDSSVPGVDQPKDDKSNKAADSHQGVSNPVHLLPPVPNAPLLVPPINSPLGC